MVEDRADPCGNRVTDLTICREPRLSMARGRRVQVVGAVATVTICGQPGIDPGAVALIAIHSRVPTR